MGKVIESKNLEKVEKLGYGSKPKVIKEKEQKKPRGKVLMSKTGDIDENIYLR